MVPCSVAGLSVREEDSANSCCDGQKIAPSAWISVCERESLMFHDGPEGISSYGYLWWLGRIPEGRLEPDLIAGAGYGSERLFIVPGLT
jgi:hypothetical protein